MTRFLLLLTAIVLPLFIRAGSLLDCPPPDCVLGYTVSLYLAPDGPCFALLFAEDLLDGDPGPECLAPVHYAIYREVEVSQPGFEPSSDDVSILLDEDDDPTTIVRVYGIDSNGDYSYCTVFILVQAYDCEYGHSLAVTGIIATEENEPVAGVEVSLSGSFVETVITESDGYFSLGPVQLGLDFSITPYKKDDLLNGATTFDLVLIAKHILGVQPLESPYQLIAADINHSGNISTLDIIHLRKAILNISDFFPNNTSWRFVDAEYAFPDHTNPWTEEFPEVIAVNNLSFDGAVVDLIAVKIGDVNHSAIPH